MHLCKYQFIYQVPCLLGFKIKWWLKIIRCLSHIESGHFANVIGMALCAQPHQWGPTLCNSMDWSPPGFSVHGILQARVLGAGGGGCHALLQEIFQTQGSNLHLLCLLHWQVGYLPPAPPGKPQCDWDCSYSNWNGDVYNIYTKDPHETQHTQLIHHRLYFHYFQNLKVLQPWNTSDSVNQ